MPIVDLNGSSIYYSAKGQGIPIVFIHPPTLSSCMFTHQIDELSPNFKTIVFDIRGHGNSQPSKSPVTYSTIVGDIKQLLDALDLQQVFLCGYSTGGAVALEFLLTYPERALGGILIGTMSEVHDLRLRLRILLGITFAKVKAIKPLALSISWSNSDNFQMFRSTYSDAQKGNARNIKEYYQSSLHYNCSGRLSRIHNPVLLVYGAKDKGFHSYATLLNSRLPNSRLVYIERIKHQIPTKAVKELNRLISDFAEKNCRSEL